MAACVARSEPLRDEAAERNWETLLVSAAHSLAASAMSWGDGGFDCRDVRGAARDRVEKATRMAVESENSILRV